MRWLRLGRGRTATALNPLLRGGTATLGEPALVLLDVDHSTNDACKVLGVMQRHERVKSAERVPLRWPVREATTSKDRLSHTLQ